MFGRTVEIVPITRSFMKEFKNQLRTLNAYLITKEVLKAIAEDFDLIARALEESAIDSAKDKSKDFGFGIDAFLQDRAGSSTLSRFVKHKGLKDNSKAVINALGGGLNTKEKADKFAYSKNYKLLSDIKTMEEEFKAEDFLVEDITGEIGVLMADITAEGLNKSLLEMLKASNVDSYYEYASKVQSLVEKNKVPTAKEKAEYNLIFMIRIALSCMMHLFSRKADIDGVTASIDSAYVSAEAQKIRDAVYNYAESLKIKTNDGEEEKAIAPEEVIRYAIMAAFSNVSLKDGTLKANNRGALMPAVQAIFPREFVMEYCSKAILAESPNLTEDEKEVEMSFLKYSLLSLHVSYSNVNLYPGAVVEFVDGECITENEERVFIEEDYTGTATVVNNYGLVADYDIYGYNSVEFILMDNIYSYNMSTIDVYNNPDMFEQMIKSLVPVNAINGQIDDVELIDRTIEEQRALQFERNNEARNKETLFVESQIAGGMPIAGKAGRTFCKTPEGVMALGRTRAVCKTEGKVCTQTAIIANVGGFIFLQHAIK